ncbi:MAG TPA: hypothetical protein VFV98_13825 [Vicinamibacterales bacterium]|nr:hypothetical protein [Vicinamibacterales bacterium]
MRHSNQMTSRSEPYRTDPIRRRWSGAIWVIELGLLLIVGRRPEPPWDTALVFLVGLAWCVQGIDAIRTGQAELTFSVWLRFGAERRGQPIRFWLPTTANLVLGGWALALVLKGGVS